MNGSCTCMRDGTTTLFRGGCSVGSARMKSSTDRDECVSLQKKRQAARVRPDRLDERTRNWRPGLSQTASRGQCQVWTLAESVGLEAHLTNLSCCGPSVRPLGLLADVRGSGRERLQVALVARSGGRVKAAKLTPAAIAQSEVTGRCDPFSDFPRRGLTNSPETFRSRSRPVWMLGTGGTLLFDPVTDGQICGWQPDGCEGWRSSDSPAQAEG